MSGAAAALPIISGIGQVGSGLVSGKGDDDAVAAQREGYQRIENMLREGMGERKKAYEETKGIIQPFYKTGLEGMEGFKGDLSKLADPKAYVNNIMSSYQTSPAAKFQMDEAMKKAQMVGSATGMAGSGAQQKGIADYAQQLTARDQQEWLNNIMGVDKMHLGGMSDLMGQGFGAAQKSGDWASSYGTDIAELLSKIGSAQYNQSASQSSSGGMLGGVLGAMSGMGKIPSSKSGSSGSGGGTPSSKGSGSGGSTGQLRRWTPTGGAPGGAINNAVGKYF